MADKLIGAVLAHIARALAGAVFGSVGGTLLTMFVFMLRDPGGQGWVTIDPSLGIPLFIVSLLFTLPSALLLAAPIIWPRRDWAIRHPFGAAFTYGAIGAIPGALISMPLFDNTGELVIAATIYGFTTGAAFIIMLWWTSPRPAPAQPLDAIFE